MIVNRQRNFGFVHIAKCAGSTIRQQLRDLDDLGGRFYRTMQHPELGRINANHLPLSVLASSFPEDLAALRAVTSYTVTREPMDRFVSGVSQLVRDRGREPAELSRDEIVAAADDVIAHMESAPDLPELSYTLFARQAVYVDLDGARVVDHVFPMESLGALFDTLEREHGLALIRDRVWNPTVTYRVPASAGLLKRLKDVAKRALPVDAYARVRDLGVQLFTTKGVPKLEETLRGSSRVAGFVRDFYGADAALHREALERHPPAPGG